MFFFPRNPPFDFQMLRLANHVATGGAEVNHLLRVAAEIPDPTPEAWYRSWQQLAGEQRERAAGALREGATETARENFLRASNYARVSAFYLSAERPEKLSSNEQSRAAFAAAQPYADHVLLDVAVPYSGRSLPGYLMLPRGAGRTSAVVFVGGADATKEELYFTAARRLLQRGHAVLVFDGPGQGASWLVNGHRATAGWDSLAPAVFETLASFPSIDPERVGLLGISMGGYYAPKIASGDPRFACLAVWGACFDVREDLYEFYPAIRRHLREIAGASEEEAPEFYAPFNLREAAREIACPVLITHGEDDRVVSLAAAHKFAQALGERAVLRTFPGASHCMYNMPAEAVPGIFDWLDARLAAKRTDVSAPELVAR